MDYVVGLDIGTTSTKGVLYDKTGLIISQAHQGYPLYREANGLAEEDPEIIFQAVVTVLQTVFQAVKNKHAVRAIAFSSANQSLMALDQNRQPLTRLMTWNDTRASKYAQQLKASLLGAKIYEQTGTPLHPMSLLCKLLWLKEERPQIFQQARYYCGIKEYVLYRLCGVWQMDLSVASCTGLFNIQQQQWDPTALNLAKIEQNQLPPVVAAQTQFSGLKHQYAQIIGCPVDITFVQGAFDGALSNLGVGALDEQSVAMTIGTSGAVRILTKQPIIDSQQRLFCYLLDATHYVVGGPVNNGGIVLQWARDNLLDVQAAETQDAYASLMQVAAKAPVGANGLLFLPFLNGERAPLWNAQARGSFVGLSALHTRADMIRAVLEGVVYNLYSVYQAVSEVGVTAQQIILTGGFVQSHLGCQIVADIFDQAVVVPLDFESSCLGAAVLAMKSLGWITDFSAVRKFVGPTKTYMPIQDHVAIYQELLPIYQRLSAQLQSEYADIAQFQIRHALTSD